MHAGSELRVMTTIGWKSATPPNLYCSQSVSSIITGDEGGLFVEPRLLLINAHTELLELEGLFQFLPSVQEGRERGREGGRKEGRERGRKGGRRRERDETFHLKNFTK